MKARPEGRPLSVIYRIDYVRLSGYMGEFKLKGIFSFCGRHSGSVEGNYGEQQTTDLVLTEHPPQFVH